MNISDPISDFLTRIRNAIRAGHPIVDIPHSKLKVHIAEILKQEGYIRDFAEDGEDGQPKRTLRILLKYHPDSGAAIRGLQRVSKPGLRKYSGATDMPRVLSGLGIAIISTSQGILTDRQARQQNIGGEVLCHIW